MASKTELKSLALRLVTTSVFLEVAGFKDWGFQVFYMGKEVLGAYAATLKAEAEAKLVTK